MAKVKLPRGLYLSARERGDALIFRWGHAPRLRAAGIRPLDLFADGRPLTRADLAAHGLDMDPPTNAAGAPLLHAGRTRPLAKSGAIEAATALTAAIKATQNAPVPRPARRAPARPAPTRTVLDLVDAFLAPSNPKLARLSPDTIRSYKSWRAPIAEIFAATAAAALTEDLIEDWYAAMREARGHRMAHGAYQLLRRTWKLARRTHGLHEILWDTIDTPQPRGKVRIATDLELTYLLRAMDDPASLAAELQLPEDAPDIPPARPELGDSLIFAIWTTQRARTVLTLTEAHVAGQRLRIKPEKTARRTGRKVDMPMKGPLPARLAAARARKARRGLHHAWLIAHPSEPGPYVQKTHGKHFRAARALAARFVPSLLGEGRDPWGDPITPFTFEDCRDTGITRLFRAGANAEQVAAWSAHKDLNALRALADAYISLDAEIADQGGDLLDAYTRQKGLVI